MARFVTEFGSQSIPDTADFMEPERWPDLDWDRLTERHKIQKSNFDKYVPPADYATFDEWRTATQRYQALVIDRHIRELRRIKYRPNGGFAQFAFADAAPLVSWAVLDHERVPEARLRRPAGRLRAGDRRRRPAARRRCARARRSPSTSTWCPTSARPLDELTCTATLTWEGGAHRWRFAGDVPADSVVRVGTIQLEAPSTPRPGRPRPRGHRPDAGRRRSATATRRS